MYKDKIPDEKLATLCADYQRVLQSLIQKTQDGSWTLNQQKRQRSSILPRIALYKTFLQYGIEKEKAIELTRERAEYLGNKANKVLKTCFAFPCFSTIFRNVFRKSMNGTEIWTSQFLKDNKKELDIKMSLERYVRLLRLPRIMRTVLFGRLDCFRQYKASYP